MSPRLKLKSSASRPVKSYSAFRTITSVELSSAAAVESVFTSAGLIDFKALGLGFGAGFAPETKTDRS